MGTSTGGDYFELVEKKSGFFPRQTTWYIAISGLGSEMDGGVLKRTEHLYSTINRQMAIESFEGFLIDRYGENFKVDLDLVYDNINHFNLDIGE